MDAEETCGLLATILAHGCNPELFTMEKVAPDIPYEQLKRISDWRLTEDNQRAALATVVASSQGLYPAARPRNPTARLQRAALAIL